MKIIPSIFTRQIPLLSVTNVYNRNAQGCSGAQSVPNVTLGTPGNRVFYIVFTGGGINATYNITSVSLGGVTGTLKVSSTAGTGSGVKIYKVEGLTSGTTATLNFTGSSSNRSTISIFSARGGKKEVLDTFTESAFNTTDLSANLNVTNDRSAVIAGFGLVGVSTGSVTTTWTNLTEVLDSNVVVDHGGGNVATYLGSSAYRYDTTAPGAFTVTSVASKKGTIALAGVIIR